MVLRRQRFFKRKKPILKNWSNWNILKLSLVIEIHHSESKNAAHRQGEDIYNTHIQQKTCKPEYVKNSYKSS